MKYCVAKFDTERVMWLYLAKEGYGYCWTSKSNDKNIVLFSKKEAETFCKEEVKKHCKKRIKNNNYRGRQSADIAETVRNGRPLRVPPVR